MSLGFATTCGLLPWRRTVGMNVDQRRPIWHCAMIGVIGATGGVGSLIVSKLLQSMSKTNDRTEIELMNENTNDGIEAKKIRILARNRDRAVKKFGDWSNMEIMEIGSTFNCDEMILRKALKDVEILFLCTGTTAFPTRAWKNGNRPKNVDDKGIKRVMECIDNESMKRVVLLSSIGTERADELPFSILNLFGVLDSKRKGEQHVKLKANEMGFSYAIIKAGRLIGEPHSNVGATKVGEMENWGQVELGKGDILKGNLSRDSAAQVAVKAGLWNGKGNMDFSVVNREGEKVCGEQLEMLLKQVETENEEQQDSLLAV